MKKTHRKKVNILIIYTLLIALLLNGCSIKRKNIWDEMQFSIRGVSVDFITTFTLQEFIDKTGYKNIYPLPHKLKPGEEYKFICSSTSKGGICGSIKNTYSYSKDCLDLPISEFSVEPGTDGFKLNNGIELWKTTGEEVFKVMGNPSSMEKENYSDSYKFLDEATGCYIEIWVNIDNKVCYIKLNYN